MNMGNVHSLEQWKSARGRPSIKFLGEESPTGARPFKCLATDGKYYWCKQIHTNHGWQSTVNEVVVSVIGQRLGAPVCNWAILNVPAELAETRLETVALGSAPVFGSEIVHFGDRLPSEDVWSGVSEDNNYERIPRLVALMLLCNAQDFQYLIEFEGNRSVWAFDFGMWFDSLESNWGLSPIDELAGRTVLPALRESIPTTKWREAIAAVNNLDDTLWADVLAAIPEEWGVDQGDIDKLVGYAMSRREYTINRLEELSARHGMEG